MTKKDFKELATILGMIQNESDRISSTDLMIPFCRRNNPRFDEDRFVEWIKRVSNNESTVGLG